MEKLERLDAWSYSIPPQRLLTDAFASNWTLHERFMLAEIDGAESVVDAVERVEQFDPDAPRQSSAVEGYGVRRPSEVDAVASQRVAETAEILEDFQKRMLVRHVFVLQHH